MVDGPQFNVLSQKSFSSSIGLRQLSELVTKQMNNFIPDPDVVASDDIHTFTEAAVDRVRLCFTWINNKYYTNSKEIFFNHLQSDHYCSFLYLLSNTAFNAGATSIATKLFLLNKYLHGLDLYFSVKLPEVFMLVHPVGSVIGNATYGNFFVAYQNCTIGSVLKDGKYIYPVFKDHVTLYARSAVIGDCRIEKDVIIGANAFLINTHVPAKSIVTGAYPQHTILDRKNIQSPVFF